jgi:HNH endonuclease
MNNRIEIRGKIAVIFVPYQRHLILECLVDIEDLPRLQTIPRSISSQWREAQQTFYCYFPRIIDGRQQNTYIHRFISQASDGFEVDHKNHNGLDNRKDNLRVGTKSQNMLNRRGAARSNRSSGVRGVNWDNTGKCWSGKVMIDGEKYHVGQFDTVAEAEKAVTEFRLSAGCLA